ncbi:MAG: PHB depolymerase family esterase [Chloroflexota bacterium]
MKQKFLALFSFLAGITMLGCSAVFEGGDSAYTSSAEAEIESVDLVQTGTYTNTLEADGLERMYLLHVPESANSPDPLPLLLNLHGFTGTSESQLGYADFRAIADREGIILVYPQGTLLNNDTHWNVGSWTSASTVDDTAFLSELIDVLIADFNVDADRVYSIGHSNGGFMSFLLACQAGEKITAIASISGTMSPENFAECEPSHPTPVLQIHGTADSVIPYGGASWTKSVEDVLDYWIEFNQLDDTPLVSEIAPNPDSNASSKVIRMEFSSADSAAVVEHIMVEGGGHEWLGQTNIAGEANLDLDTNEEIWSFLSQFSLDQLEP